MNKLPRLAWEFLIFVVLMAVGYGWWTWSDYRWQRGQAELEERLHGELAEERAKTEQILTQRGAAEAEVVGLAFAAGIGDAVTSSRPEAVDVALGELLRIPGIVFAHVLDSEGGVIATSDRKLVATGRAGPRADWALNNKAESAVRPGTTPQSTEVAIPVGDGEDDGSSGTAAVLWIAYEIVTGEAAPEPASPEVEEEATEPAESDESLI